MSNAQDILIKKFLHLFLNGVLIFFMIGFCFFSWWFLL